MSTDKSKQLRFFNKYNSNKPKKQPLVKERTLYRTEDDINLHPESPTSEIKTQNDSHQNTEVSNEEIKASAMQSWYQEEANKQAEQDDGSRSNEAISLGYNDAESYDDLVENSISELTEFFS